jgi:hypothetical protein
MEHLKKEIHYPLMNFNNISIKIIMELQLNNILGQE